MLILKSHMLGASVEAPDGKLGELRDLLFDERWNIRSLVAAGGTWVKERRITLPPALIHRKNWAASNVAIAALTCRQVIDTPETEHHIPLGPPGAVGNVTTEAWDLYWIHLGLHPWQVASDPELRSVDAVTGYHLVGVDAVLGHLADFVIDDDAWTVSHLAVDTRPWRKGKLLLVPPADVKILDWGTRTIHLALARERLAKCPELATLVAAQPPPLTAAGA